MDDLCHYINFKRQIAPTASLNKIALLVLVILHSNTEEERVFLIFQKNKTTLYSNLDPKGRLSSILVNSQPAKTDAVLKKASWECNKIIDSKLTFLKIYKNLPWSL